MNSGSPYTRLVGALIFLLAATAATAMDWPSGDQALESSFGQNLGGRPSFGVSFSGVGPVRAADAGEVVFARSSEDRASGIPSALGPWIAIDHGDGIVSVYGGLDDATLPVDRTIVERDSLIGRVSSGVAGAKTGFFFSLIDRKAGRYVNPALLSPPRPDDRAPVIRELQLVATDGETIPLPAHKALRQGSYALRLLVFDQEGEGRIPKSGSASLAPLSISGLLDGEERCSLRLETLTVESGTAYALASGPEPVQKIYDRDGFYRLGQLPLKRGRSLLQIVVLDAAGNERSVSYHIVVE